MPAYIVSSVKPMSYTAENKYMWVLEISEKTERRRYAVTRRQLSIDIQ